MATYSKLPLSGSTNGRPIKVTATATPGTTLHTTTSGAVDELWIYAMNNDTVYRLLTIEWGGTTNPDDRIVLDVPPQTGLVLVIPGLVLTYGASVIVRAFCEVTNVVNIAGFVNRIT